MQKEGKYVSVQDVIRANQDGDVDNLGNIEKLVEVYGHSKMQPRKDEVYMTFKSPYIKNPLSNIKEKNLEKVNRYTRERRKSMNGSPVPFGATMNMMSSSDEDDDDDQ